MTIRTIQVPLKLLDDEGLEAIREWASQQDQTINVGQVQGDFDEHLESTAGYAVRLAKELLALMTQPVEHGYRSELAAYFGLSYASWLTLPRVLMQAMPEDWQSRMAVLLHEYSDAIKNPPDLGTTVRMTVGGKLVETPAWLLNYRHPDRAMIAQVMGKAGEGEGRE